MILGLLSEQPDLHGYEIVKQLKSKSGDRIVIKENRLYPALHKLEQEGVLEASLVPHGGRTRKTYKLTESGLKESATAQARLQDVVAALSGILKPISHA
jgi:DNA-binding PadR family transcriptional regulator